MSVKQWCPAVPNLVAIRIPVGRRHRIMIIGVQTFCTASIRSLRASMVWVVIVTVARGSGSEGPDGLGVNGLTLGSPATPRPAVAGRPEACRWLARASHFLHEPALQGAPVRATAGLQ
jgi:hypothetical protein